MNKFNFFVFGLLFVVASFSSCNKDNDGNVSSVFVAGQDGNSAALWKNGIAQSLTGTLVKNEPAILPKTWANSVYVSGNDVYVAGGIRNEQDVNVAVLWKNGEIQHLSDGTDDSNAFSVFVSGNDVYVAGSEGIFVTLWKNGKAKNITDETYSGYAYSVYVSNGDVYMAGGVIVLAEVPDIKSFAKLWKNGESQNLINNEHGFAKSVFVSGGNVYVAGQGRNMNGEPVPVLWKNGESQNLNAGFGGASSVFVSGNDVYVAGIDNGRATLWTNGVAQYLTDGTNTGWANSVYVKNRNVYVVGVAEAGSGVITLWTNGVAQNLAFGKNEADAHSVFVK